jgi:YegS/Rv2252/BmrU family lipid kinase
MGEFDLVVVVGGDGTVDEVVAGLDGTDIPVGIIPLGTANVLSLDLNIPQNPVEAAHTIVAGRTRSVDVGYINGRPFVLMASAGFDAFTVHSTEPRIKVWTGKLAYVFSALWSALAYRWKRLTVEVPEEGIRDSGYLAIASNSRYYGGRVNFDPEIRIDDGKLDLLLFKKASILEVFRTLMALLVRAPLRPSELAVYRSRRFVLSAKSRMYLQVDGDKVPDHEADIGIGPGRLRVFVP